MWKSSEPHGGASGPHRVTTFKTANMVIAVHQVRWAGQECRSPPVSHDGKLAWQTICAGGTFFIIIRERGPRNRHAHARAHRCHLRSACNAMQSAWATYTYTYAKTKKEASIIQFGIYTAHGKVKSRGNATDRGDKRCRAQQGTQRHMPSTFEDYTKRDATRLKTRVEDQDQDQITTTKHRSLQGTRVRTDSLSFPPARSP